MTTTGKWYDCKIGVKLPFCVYFQVPIMVMYTEETGDYEITRIEYVPIPEGKPKPDWGNYISEIGWLQKYAMPELWGQIAFQIHEQRKED